ncbi:zinc-ribbon domain-containing protein [Pseudoroseomonas globiformis]|uniref:Zinc-ribbon domain-containing protein n=1 Tax=Teichococcus globiformis TaxID=2307229 RepID=A0ABV7FXJ2_9PROT
MPQGNATARAIMPPVLVDAVGCAMKRHAASRRGGLRAAAHPGIASRMRLECPACTATYDVPDSMASSPRELRCALCGHRWRPAAEMPASRAGAPEPRLPQRNDPGRAAPEEVSVPPPVTVRLPPATGLAPSPAAAIGISPAPPPPGAAMVEPASHPSGPTPRRGAGRAEGQFSGPLPRAAVHGARPETPTPEEAPAGKQGTAATGARRRHPLRPKQRSAGREIVPVGDAAARTGPEPASLMAEPARRLSTASREAPAPLLLPSPAPRPRRGRLLAAWALSLLLLIVAVAALWVWRGALRAAWPPAGWVIEPLERLLGG